MLLYALRITAIRQYMACLMGCQHHGTADSAVTVPRHGVPHHVCLCSDYNYLLLSHRLWREEPRFFIHISEM